MTTLPQIEKTLASQNLKAFKKQLVGLSFSDFFKETQGELSLWHSMIYEPMDVLFVQAVFDWADSIGEKFPIDIQVKKESYQGGRTAYLIATAFGMKDKMEYLASKGADVCFSFKRGKTIQDAQGIAEEFFGPSSEIPCPEIIDLVRTHQANQQRKNISDVLPKALDTEKLKSPKL